MVIVVLGPPRSGTSLMAGILHSNGICMGEGFHCGDGRPASANPKGYFEDNRLTHLNIDVLRAAGGNYLAMPPEDKLRAAAIETSMDANIALYLERRSGLCSD